MHTILTTTSTFGNDAPHLFETLKENGFQTVSNPFGRKLAEEELESLLDEHKPIGLLAGTEPIKRFILPRGVYYLYEGQAEPPMETMTLYPGEALPPIVWTNAAGDTIATDTIRAKHLPLTVITAGFGLEEGEYGIVEYAPSIENIYSRMRRVFDHYYEQGEQQRKQAYAALKADFEARVQQAAQQQLGSFAGVGIDVE